MSSVRVGALLRAATPVAVREGADLGSERAGFLAKGQAVRVLAATRVFRHSGSAQRVERLQVADLHDGRPIGWVSRRGNARGSAGRARHGDPLFEQVGLDEVGGGAVEMAGGTSQDDPLHALHSAIRELDSIAKCDIVEVKSFAKPPPGVEMVMDAVPMPPPPSRAVLQSCGAARAHA